MLRKKIDLDDKNRHVTSVSIFYTIYGDSMIVYVDLVFTINMIFDFIILSTVDILLKRNTKIYRLILGSLVGELSMLTLFFNIDNIMFKIILTILMSMCTYGYKDIKYTLYNIVYLYLVGIILGGFIYYLYNEFNIGTRVSLKYFIVVLISPIILFVYTRMMNNFKNNYNNRYKVHIEYMDNVFDGIGFLDSGNTLESPINHKPIILVEKEYLVCEKLKLLPVPFNALNHSGIVYTFKPDYVEINDKEVKGILIGISDINFNLDGVEVLLNANMGDIC